MKENVGRIDITNTGSLLNFQIAENNNNLKIKPITWYKDKSGVFFDELPEEGSFVLKACEDMQINFNLKGIDRRTPDKQFIEKWCTFIHFRVNGKNILPAPTRVWHNKSYNLLYLVKKDEEIKINYAYVTNQQEVMLQVDLLRKDINTLKYTLGKMFWDLKNIHILSQKDTIEAITNKNLSIARFGDGEVRWMLLKGFNAGFQRYNEKLAHRLLDIVSSSNEKLLVCLAGAFDPHQTRNDFWEHCVSEILFDLTAHIKQNQTFGDTNITRNADNVPLMKKIWKGKDVVIVEGEQSRMGVGNDLFNNVKTLHRILCPSENAFDHYDKILAECLKSSKESLFLLALGPTATVLAYDLCLAGYRALDVGHIDICYEWKLRGATEKILIPGKYVNEVKGGNQNISECTDEAYLKSIIARVL